MKDYLIVTIFQNEGNISFLMLWNELLYRHLFVQIKHVSDVFQMHDLYLKGQRYQNQSHHPGFEAGIYVKPFY